MKFMTLTGGLGNQMFIYAFCLSLRNRGLQASLFIPSKKKTGYGHQGYELEKLFPIVKYQTKIAEFCTRGLEILSFFVRFVPHRWRIGVYKFFGISTVNVPENFIFYPHIFDFKNENEIYIGTWQSELFFATAKADIRKEFVFKESLLSTQTLELGKQIQERNSVSIHIRRGDYLSAQYSSGFAGVCDDEYYKNAIEMIEKSQSNCHYYIFTDDKDWVLTHFKLKNATFVVHNSGANSWQDMYLMSLCKHNIIANSSFSWWGAWLNQNPQKKVIAPKKWWKLFDQDDVVPSDWTRV